jgi:hypothetical protein
MEPPNDGTVSPKLLPKAELFGVCWDHCDEAEEGSVPKSLADSDAEKSPLVVDEAADGAADGIPAK